eukprot:GHVU01069555.1.p1 GENE.GHVU01069555.1~~GHVU01069555.1.p1  ORF type:complete len:192 (+),score=13.13 GHVU01069555.1:158-733(+)
MNPAMPALSVSFSNAVTSRPSEAVIFDSEVAPSTATDDECVLGSGAAIPSAVQNKVAASSMSTPAPDPGECTFSSETTVKKGSCCDCMTQSALEACKGVTWGWGFTSKPRKGWRYYWTEISVGVIIAFAQVPETVAFSLMAYVQLHVGLHAAWLMGLFGSLFGGRPGQINGATGATVSASGRCLACSSSTK